MTRGFTFKLTGEEEEKKKKEEVVVVEMSEIFSVYPVKGTLDRVGTACPI
jgi:hypothetical protein